MPKDANRLLQQVRLAASEADWPKVIDLSSAQELVQEQPKILRYRLLAGSMTADLAIIEDVVDTTIKTDMPLAEAFALVREIGQAGFRDSAARLLLEKPSLRGHEHFQRAAGRALKTKIAIKLRRQLRDAVLVASKGGTQIKPVLSQVSFAKSNQKRSPLGSVTIAAQSSTADAHIQRLTSDRDRFIRSLKVATHPRVVEHTNVFVNRFGQIWNEDGAIIRHLGRPITTLNPSDVPNIDTALSALSATRGIYHWLVDNVPPIACLAPLRAAAAGLPILLRGDAAPFEAETLAYIGVRPDRIISVADAVFVKRLLISKPGISALSNWDMFTPVFEPLVEHALYSAAAAAIDLPKKIYISRSRAKRRPMANEAAIEAVAVEQGFSIFHFEDLPLWHQIALVSNADTIMAPHGAGLAHLIFAGSGTNVIEILPIRGGDSTYKLRWNYARLSLARGHRYAAWLEEQPPHTEAWAVDLGEFLPFLNAQLASNLRS